MKATQSSRSRDLCHVLRQTLRETTHRAARFHADVSAKIRNPRRCVEPPSALAAVALLFQRLQLGHDLEVLRPSRGALHDDQRLEVQAEHPESKHLDGGAARAKVLERASTGDLTQQVEISEGCGQREVE